MYRVYRVYTMTTIDQAEKQWVEAVRNTGSKQVTLDGVGQAYTARERLAKVLWLAAIKGDLRAATLVLKYDLGLGGEVVAPALVPDEVTDALDRIYDEQSKPADTGR